MLWSKSVRMNINIIWSSSWDFFTTFKCTNHLYCIRGSSSSNHVNNVRPYMETGLRNRLLQVSLFVSLLRSPRRGRFVLWGGWGERNRERVGQDGKEKERREAHAFSLFPSFPAGFLFFDYCYFYWDTLREHLRRRELFCNKLGERQRAGFPFSPLAHAHFPVQNFA